MNFRNFFSTSPGWDECTFEDYLFAYRQYGGSNCTHPAILDFLQSNTPEQYHFLSNKTNGKLSATVFINSSGGFCLPGKHNSTINDDEIIFPADRTIKILLLFSSKKISSLYKNCLVNKLPSALNKRKVCLARTNLCSKTKKNRRNEMNRFFKKGGGIVPASEYSAQKLCSIYNSLMTKRWGKGIDSRSLETLEKFLFCHPDMVFGNILEVDGKTCAFDLIIKSESPEWFYFDVLNGGVDPEYMHLSAGSVLMWVNIQQAVNLCEKNNKMVRFSLGKPTMSYKNRWCNSYDLLCTL